MKPAFSYYGGKQRMASKILPLLPKHTCYVEPFAGGATLLFAKGLPAVTNKHHYRECINDTNHNVVNFYRVLREQPEALIHALELTPYSRHEHDVVAREPTDDPVERARRWYTDIMQGVGARERSGWSRTQNVLIHRPLAVRAAVDRLEACAERLRGVYVDCRDALDVIRMWDSPTTLFYCDPPYPGADQGHYGGYTLNDFRELVATLSDCQGSWVVSNYDQECVDWPTDVRKASFDAVATAGPKVGASRRTEVVWVRARNQDAPIFDRIPAPFGHNE